MSAETVIKIEETSGGGFVETAGEDAEEGVAIGISDGYDPLSHGHGDGIDSAVEVWESRRLGCDAKYAAKVSIIF